MKLQDAILNPVIYQTGRTACTLKLTCTYNVTFEQLEIFVNIKEAMDGKLAFLYLFIRHITT